jgi:hypothetical protein
LNVASSSAIDAYFQFSSVSNSSSAWAYLDTINAAVTFPGTLVAPTTPGTFRTLELRAESISRLPVNAAKYVRLQVVVSAPTSTVDLFATVQAAYFRNAPNVPLNSASLSNTIYSSVDGGSITNVV